MKKATNTSKSYKQLEKMVKSIASFIASQSTKAIPKENDSIPQKENTSEVVEHKDGKRGEGVKWTEKWGFWANVGMLVFTAFLFWQTKVQTANSTAAIKEANEANQLTKQNIKSDEIRDKAADSTQRIRDSISNENINKSLAIAKQNADAVTQGTETARRAAITNERSAEFYKQSTMQQDRAYLIVDTITIVGKIDSIREVHVTIKNIGKTPAYNVRLNFRMIAARIEQDFNYSWFKEDNFSKQDFNVPAGESQSAAFLNPITISKGQVFDFNSKRLDLLMAIKIEYIDVFKNKHHTNKFTKMLSKWLSSYNCERGNDWD